MTLHDLNALSPQDAERAFLKCCGSRKWAGDMTARRPFAAVTDVLATAEDVATRLNDTDWLEAFAAHPRIGERSESAWSQSEQAAALNAEQEIQAELARKNKQYEEKFGFIFIVFAAGKSPEKILELIDVRMQNDRRIEIDNAAREQRQITRTRLHKLLEL